MSRAVGQRRYLTNFESHRLPHLFTDVLVLGSGMAGLRAALEAGQHADVLLVTKESAAQSATQYAQGGIAVAFPPDTPEAHADDTLRIAAGLADARIVRQVTREGPAELAALQRWGAQFDLEQGVLATGREGAHSARRIVHASGDATGREIVRVLLEQTRRHPRIRVFEHCYVIDLLSADGRVVGAVTAHPKYGHQMFWATTTVLATGGASRAYRENTGPSVCTGDGLALALRAGAALRDMEMIQFHPTTLYVAGAARTLISEAVRGEGAYLLNRAGERFMEKYDPRGELAARDVVSRAIAAEMKREASPFVYLDVRHFPSARFAERFPNLDRLCRDFDLDPRRDLIPVRPAAHYTVGGVPVDADGQTSIDGLLACGEVACTGLHGANRLASNSLLEGVVFGRRSGRRAAERALELPRIERPLRLNHVMPPSPRTELDVPDVLHSLQSMMSRNVAIERSADRLRETIEIIDFWSRYVLDKVLDGPQAWETQNMLTVALTIATGAATRCESRGVHYRSDYPRADPAWARHIDIRRGEEGLEVATTTVEFAPGDRVTPQLDREAAPH